MLITNVPSLMSTVFHFHRMKRKRRRERERERERYVDQPRETYLRFTRHLDASSAYRECHYDDMGLDGNVSIKCRRRKRFQKFTLRSFARGWAGARALTKQRTRISNQRSYLYGGVCTDRLSPMHVRLMLRRVKQRLMRSASLHSQVTLRTDSVPKILRGSAERLNQQYRSIAYPVILEKEKNKISKITESALSVEFLTDVHCL